MCLIALAIDQSRRFPLVVAANRDEFFARPATRLGWWEHDAGGPAILAGRDLTAGGTWLGLTAEGRLAMVTNVRDPARMDPTAPSRGVIVPQWLSGREPTDRFWMRTALSGYNGFNLIAADFKRGECFWASNLGAHPKRLERGVYGVSNASLDTAWPKTIALRPACARPSRWPIQSMRCRARCFPHSRIARSQPTPTCPRPAFRWSSRGSCHRYSSAPPNDSTARGARRW